MAKYVFVFVQDHTVEIPPTVLETKTSADGPVENTINIPGSTITYKVGQQVTFKNKGDAACFTRNMGDKVKKL